VISMGDDSNDADSDQFVSFWGFLILQSIYWVKSNPPTLIWGLE